MVRVALEIGYLDRPTYNELYNQALDLSRMLSSQIQAINRSLRGLSSNRTENHAKAETLSP